MSRLLTPGAQQRFSVRVRNLRAWQAQLLVSLVAGMGYPAVRKIQRSARKMKSEAKVE